MNTEDWTGAYACEIKPNGKILRSIPAPFYWGLFPWVWLRLSGYRDHYGRKAAFIGWREGIIPALFERW